MTLSTHKPLTVYKASAGSGKTFTLATEYMKLVIANPEAYRSILAVTFTNKATEEMKLRIISQLYGLSKLLPESETYLKVIQDSLGMDREQIAKRAHEALYNLLHHYSYFRVETIDSFFQRVMRNLAKELELSANLKLELNDREIERQAVDELIEGLSIGDKLLTWILDYIKGNIGEDKNWNVIGKIKRFGENLSKDFYKANEKQLRQKLEEEGLVVQVSGGVQAAKRLHIEPSHQVKENLMSEEKKRIGKKASAIIPKNSCIYLDAGTTSLALARFIADRNDLTVVSNDLAVMDYLALNSKSTLIMTGGIVRTENLSTVGHLTSKMILNLSIDIAFMSASSWDLRGITTPDPDKVPVKEAAVQSANKAVLICDSSKYAQYATYLAVPLDKIDMLISDVNLSELAQRSLIKQGIELSLV